MTQISEAIKTLIEKKAQLKLLEKEIRELTSVLVAEHSKSGKDLILEDGYQSKISHAIRKTPLIPAITELVGHELPESCFKLTSYDTIRTDFVGTESGVELLNESK